ncbi:MULTISPECIES: MurR/RpiR family transcriptional regulator [unclassified Staphylococcus]|uniref:MurR/RpiR family transcriptional regulator n=1 Tax=unclassified Staphylococcus TaxID=91994 RepID=UPI00187ED3CB|nr:MULTISPECIES: MurR/RpiR family transcriptional regulator [unclassified Staphylococcus]MBF2756444.1 MurR/RpiR family transcriptional regulator [Staphylococcus haemolyticus]MBF2773691.1 MurR/RpiR family transcriptional regulator [Staphylococcus haemolyticus]MBF2775808.1 MurR/RpiR family transcriptional regulator [Staphylococcus haemolyticus]MBF2815377.1 MurR/RpiR family transcriptional regulator [Staphylococcus haemolyticus]MBF9719850.1 MurR/RpiR family transcriptional regulator [Staphylococc
MHGSLIFIESSLSDLNPSERRVAEYILKHPEEIINYSVQKLADLTNVSVATIVRLSKKMKCKGFQELKLKIAFDLNEPGNVQRDYAEIDEDYSIEEVTQSVFHNNTKTLKDTERILSTVSIKQAFELIINSRKTCIYGIGASAIIAQDFKQKLTRIDYWCDVGSSFDEQVTLSANLSSEDVVIAISNSGQTKDIVYATQLAKEKGAKIISITKYGDNSIAKLADVQLFVSSSEKTIRSGAMSSRIAMLSIIDILYICIASDDYLSNRQKLENTRNAIKNNKLK